MSRSIYMGREREAVVRIALGGVETACALGGEQARELALLVILDQLVADQQAIRSLLERSASSRRVTVGDMER